VVVLRRSADHSRWQRPEHASAAEFFSLPGISAMLAVGKSNVSSAVLFHASFQLTQYGMTPSRNRLRVCSDF
jgi:hypothetical protein